MSASRAPEVALAIWLAGLALRPLSCAAVVRLIPAGRSV